MERDVRRDRGQWKGCHSFKNGGLKMGETYYYYYELDGSTEVHDQSLPSTTACQSLPGQPVNTIYVPFEMSARKRSASLSSVRDCDFMTVKPEHKYVAPRVAPPVPEPAPCRQATSHVRSLVHKRSTRSLSPSPPWSWSPRRLFSRSKSSHSHKESERSEDDADSHQAPSILLDERDERTSFRSPSAMSSRSRDISPDSLLRFLSDDTPLPLTESVVDEDTNGTYLAIPDDIAEEVDDDDNFATSAQSESAPVTVLSPPPSQRSSPSSSTTLSRLARSSRPQTPAAPTRTAPTLPALQPVALKPMQSGLSADSPAPHSPESTASQTPSFYFSEDDDDDEDDDDGFVLMPLQGITTSFDASFGSLLSTFAGYTLPEAATSDNKVEASAAAASATEAARPLASASPLAPARIAEPRDLIDELRWMAPAVVKT